MAETDSPKNSVIIAMVVGTVFTLLVVILVIIQYFNMAVRAETEAKVLTQTASNYRDLKAYEGARLTRYAWVDQKGGVVRVPLERAMELTLRDWEKRPTGLMPNADAAAAAPAKPAAAAAAAPAAPAPAAPAPAAPAPAK